jgi:hypothetical protein
MYIGFPAIGDQGDSFRRMILVVLGKRICMAYIGLPAIGDLVH